MANDARPGRWRVISLRGGLPLSLDYVSAQSILDMRQAHHAFQIDAVLLSQKKAMG